MHYKLKNSIYPFFLIASTTIVFVCAAFFSENLLIVKSNIFLWFLGFFVFYFLTTNLIYWIENLNKKNNYNFKVPFVLLILIGIFSLLPMALALIVYSFNLSQQKNLWIIIEFVVVYFIFIILNFEIVKLIISFALHDNLEAEFINENSWFLIRHKFKYKLLDKQQLILFDKKNLFLINLNHNKNENFKIQFEEKKEIEIETIEEKKEVVNDIFKEIEEQEKAISEKKTQIIIIKPNNNAQKLLDIYQKYYDQTKFNYLISVFYQTKKITVSGKIPDWFYWNDNNKFKNYLINLKKINYKQKIKEIVTND